MSVEFENNIMRINAAIDSFAEQLLEEAGEVLEAQAKRNTKKKTSHTAQAWTHVVDMSEKSVTIGNPLENAVWEEYGTGEYAQKGDGRKGGWVYCDDDENFHFTLGKNPKRMLHNAFHTKKTPLIRRAQQLMKEKLE